MKRLGVLLAVTLMAASILSGCIVVPGDGWHEGYHEGWHGGSRGGWHEGRHEGWHEWGR